MQFEESILKICETLRETDIKQTCGLLYNKKTGNKCALGVLSCKYYKDLTKTHVFTHHYHYILEACGMSPEYAGSIFPSDLIRSTPPALTHYTMSDIILYLNDGVNFTFKEIADYLETTFIPENYVAEQSKQ